MITDETCNRSFWTTEQDKAFENALAIYWGDSDQWEKIAAAVPGKTLDEIRHHYDLLIEDLYAIESGHVPLPFYSSSLNDSVYHAGDLGFGENRNQFVQMHVGDQNGQMHVGQNGDQFEQMQSDSSHGKKSSGSVNNRRKGIPWTEEEHRLFLLGLEKYGKGDWRSISRNVVVSRTPTQVASHAQKYYIRLKSVNKAKRRSSIHDITTVVEDASAPQGPITWQMTGGTAAAGSSDETRKPPFGVPDVDMHVPPVFQSMHLPLISPVSTPYLPYGVHPTTPGFFIPTPMNMVPMTYFMPPHLQLRSDEILILVSSLSTSLI